MLIVIINAIIWFGLGYTWAKLHTNSKQWSKWEDVGVQYNDFKYDWYMLQQRTNTATGKKRYNKIPIQKYGSLSHEIINNLKHETN